MTGFKTLTTTVMILVFLAVVILSWQGILPGWAVIAALVVTIAIIWAVLLYAPAKKKVSEYEKNLRK